MAALCPVNRTLVFGTDASGGPKSADPRTRTIGWGVTAAKKVGNDLTIVGTISGMLPKPATVADGEVRAMVEVIRAMQTVEHCSFDVTTPNPPRSSV